MCYPQSINQEQNPQGTSGGDAKCACAGPTPSPFQTHQMLSMLAGRRRQWPVFAFPPKNVFRSAINLIVVFGFTRTNSFLILKIQTLQRFGQTHRLSNLRLQTFQALQFLPFWINAVLEQKWIQVRRFANARNCLVIIATNMPRRNAFALNHTAF